MATIYGSPTFKAFGWTDESNIPDTHEEAKDMKSAEETKALVLEAFDFCSTSVVQEFWGCPSL